MLTVLSSRRLISPRPEHEEFFRGAAPNQRAYGRPFTRIAIKAIRAKLMAATAEPRPHLPPPLSLVEIGGGVVPPATVTVVADDAALVFPLLSVAVTVI